MKKHESVTVLLVLILMLMCNTTSTAKEFRFIPRAEFNKAGEVRLSSYRLPSGDLAVLFTRLLYGSHSKSVSQLVYVDLENARSERRRIWQNQFSEFNRFPSSRIVSFVFGPGDSEDTLSFALSSNSSTIYVYLLDLTKSIPPKEQEQRLKTKSKPGKAIPSGTVPFFLHVGDILPAEHDNLNAGPPMLENIVYTRDDGWKLTFHIDDKLFTCIGAPQTGVPSLWQEQLKWFKTRYEEGNLLMNPVVWRLVND